MKMWVSGLDGNPDSQEYGQKVADYANMYSSPECDASTFMRTRIPHGEIVEMLETVNKDAYRVRYGDKEGYVQYLMLVDYNPIEGHEPHPFYED
jgi:hypothetical protein